MSATTLTSSRLQIHQEFGVGLVLEHSDYYSIVPKQRKLSAKLQITIKQLIILSLVADFGKSEGPSQSKTQEVHDEALPLPSTSEVSAPTRHYNAGANDDTNVVRLFPGNRRYCRWWILYCPTLETYGSEGPSVGYKRAGSPGSGNQSGGKKKGSGRENNDRNDDKDNKGNGQGPGKKKRGSGPRQPFVKKLACLFFKLKPREYQGCAGYDLSKWDHVLQHLKRKHRIEGDHCPKCRQQFRGEFAEAERNEHIRQDTCVERTILDTGILLQNEYDDLAGLHGSHEEKWFKAWEKLFGQQPAPFSPFFETVDCMLEMQQSTMERELPIILQSFRRDILARREGDTTSDTMDAILRLLRNPTTTSNSLVQDDAQDLLAPSAMTQISLVQDMPPGHDPMPWLNTIEPYRPSTGDLYDQPQISTMEARPLASPEMPNMVPWTQPLEDPPLFVDEDEIFRQWMNCPEDGQYLEELDNIGHTLE